MAGLGSCLLIVALGASNTAGYGVGGVNAFPAEIERLLKGSGIDACVTNAGVPGHTTQQMLDRLDQDVPAETKVVLFQPGSNDERLGIPDAVREQNIRTITERLTARHIAVIRVAKAFETARPGNLQSDGIHYTAAGHALIARLLIDEVTAALTR
ncbi:MAG: hypothetical protein JSS20_07225 [Proteobacteria bacterium]|nr:hypothetical protein [Pseudomonadota bacterium]